MTTKAPPLELLRVMAMPFQLSSLLFVAISSFMFGVILGGDLIRMLIGLAALWIMLVWFTTYAFRMIEDAANGVRAATVADSEMTNPFTDARGWMHPALAVALTGLHLWKPALLPLTPTLVIAALLFPPSIAAAAMSGLARDAINPVAVFNVIRGLGPWYPALVAACAGFALLGMQVVRLLDRSMLMFALLEVMLLMAYACIGGVVHLRRVELGFAPRFSPERRDERAEQERTSRRQKMFDEMFEQSRGRHGDRVLQTITQWLAAAEPHQRHGDVQALIASGARWNEPREFGRMLRGLLPLLVQWRQPALALSVADAGLAAVPSFAPAEETTAIALIDYAVQSGRRRAGATLLANYLAAQPAEQEPRLAALRSRWHSLV